MSILEILKIALRNFRDIVLFLFLGIMGLCLVFGIPIIFTAYFFFGKWGIVVSIILLIFFLCIFSAVDEIEKKGDKKDE